MEKNTKILLGVGAVIAAYLILKPKKAVGQEPLTELQKQIQILSLQKLQNPRDVRESPAPRRGGCACIAAPCDCGGGISGGYVIM